MTFSFVPDLQGVRAVLQRVFIVPIIYLLFSAMPIFLGVWETGDRISDRACDAFRSRDNTFDFIVVGSGSAGAVVANRLSKHFSVLMLEAGGDPNPLQNLPGLSLHLISHPQTDWMYRSVPQRKSCLNSVNQQSSWSAGKTLGGTGSLNFMMHLRGHSRDFDNWARITGDNSWGYDNVVPFFKRHEDFHGPTTDPTAKGSGGDLRVEYPDYKGMAQHWLKAGEELNYPSVDFNGRFLEGFAVNQYAVMQGVRQAPYRAFIQPIRRRSNLTIRKFATVNRIIFRDMSNSAYGVEYERHGKTKVAIATKEVIISAGTIGSPKLLMLSGIGPRQHLQELGVCDVIRGPEILNDIYLSYPLADLPVGQNLQDHLTTYLPFKVNSPNSFFMDRDMTPTSLVKWVLNGGGPLSSAGSQASALVSSSYAKSRGESDWPDIHLTLNGYGGERTFGQDIALAYNLQEDQMKKYYDPFVGQDSFQIGVTTARPVSRGEITLSSRNSRESPVIDPKYLEDSEDLDFKVMVQGVKLAMHLVENTTSFQKLGATFTTSKLPGCENYVMKSDEYWRCYIRRFSVSNFGPSGTVAMGPVDSLNSVVDPELRVINTKGLRVIDSSVMPTGVSTNLQAATMMIGEKGADMILKDWGIREGSTGNGPPKNNPFEMIFGGNGKSLFENFLGIAGGKNGNPLEGLFQMKGNKNFKRDSNRQENITDVSNVVNVPSVFDQNENNTIPIPNPLDNLINVMAGGSNTNTAKRDDPTNSIQNAVENSNGNTPNLFTNIFSGSGQSNTNNANPNPFANIFGVSNDIANPNVFANIFGAAQSSANEKPISNTLGESGGNSGQNPFTNIFGSSQSENNKNNDIFGNIFGTNKQTTTNNNNNRNPLEVLFGRNPATNNNNNQNNIFGIFSPNNNNQQKNILESIFTPSTERPKNILETIFSPPTERPKNILETIFSPTTERPKNILETIFSPPTEKPKNIFENIFSPPTEKPKNIFENIFAPQPNNNNNQNNIFANIFSPPTEKPKNILDNIFAPQPNNNNQNNNIFGNIFTPNNNNNNNQPKNIFGNIFGNGNQQTNSNPPQNNNLFGNLFGNNNNNNNNNKNPFEFLFGSGRSNNAKTNPFDVLFQEEKKPAGALETLIERLTGSTNNDNRNPNLFDILFGRTSGTSSAFDILFGRRSFFQGFLKGLFNNNNNNNNNNDLNNNIIPMRALAPKNPLEGLFGANKNNSGLNVFEIFGR